MAVSEMVAEVLELDLDGYLVDIDAWNIGVAERLSRLEGIGELNADHWKLICAIRRHYEKHGVSPLCRDIERDTGFTKSDMYSLFPGAGYRTAFKLAGLPKPLEC